VENRSGQIAWYINRPIRNVLDSQDCFPLD
jgi:hypothetical protein